MAKRQYTKKIVNDQDNISSENAKVSTEANTENEEKAVEHGTSNEYQQTAKAEKTESNKVVKEKVIEVKTEKVQRRNMPHSERKNNSFEVFVKGKSRMISRQAYEAVSKDPKLNVHLPKGSPLAANLEPNDKPCKDC